MAEGIRPEHWLDLGGKKYPLFAGVLAEAHSQGLLRIETNLIQAPTQANEYTAIVKAAVWMVGVDGESHRQFEAHGDANPKNTKMLTALIRIAETRAVGRAMRNAVNIGETLYEEMADEVAHAVAPAHAGQAAPAPPAPVAGALACTDCGVALTSGQAAVSGKAYGKHLCPACQKTHARLA